jgi:hypothetical protein
LRNPFFKSVFEMIILNSRFLSVSPPTICFFAFQSWQRHKQSQ